MSEDAGQGAQVRELLDEIDVAVREAIENVNASEPGKAVASLKKLQDPITKVRPLVSDPADQEPEAFTQKRPVPDRGLIDDIVAVVNDAIEALTAPTPALGDAIEALKHVLSVTNLLRDRQAR
jgi:hypothetical protein